MVCMMKKTKKCRKEERRRQRLAAVIALLLLFLSSGCTAGTADSTPGPSGQGGGAVTEDSVSKEGYYLDTVCTISVYDMQDGLTEEAANEAIDAAFLRCEELEGMLSNTRATSEVSRINESGGAPCAVSDETWEVLQAGIDFGDLSGGDFDITIGRVTDLWDYHAAEPVVPSVKSVEEAVSHVDYQAVRMVPFAESGDGATDAIQIEGGQDAKAQVGEVYLTDPAANIDLGGIAKGYISWEIAKVLRDHGVTSAIVNLGGNVVTIGEKPGARPFVVGLEKPFSDHTEIIGSVEVRDKAVITSGIYERKFEVDGEIYHHILDPKTGRPAKTDLEAVSLVLDSDRAMEGDALSTICLIKGADQARELIEGIDGVEGVFCKTDGTMVMTDGMEMTPAQ